MASQELSPIKWARGDRLDAYWTLYDYKTTFGDNPYSTVDHYVPIYVLPQTTGTIEVKLKGGNFQDSESQYRCIIFGLLSLRGDRSVRTQLLAETNSDGRFSLTLDGTEYSHIAVCALWSGTAYSEVDVDYVRLTDGSQGSQGSDPTPRTVQVTVSPGSPSGTSVDSSKFPEFTWRISNVPQGVTYNGTRIEVTTADDVNFQSISESWYVRGYAESKSDTRTFSSYTGWIWRTKADISGTPTDGTVLDPNDPTPWSQQQYFKTKDPEQGSISGVNLTRPDNGATFNYGNQISLSWSIDKTSNIEVDHTYVYIDGEQYGDVLEGNVTSKTIDSSNSLPVGKYEWYVEVHSKSSGGSGVSITPIGGSGIKSKTRTFSVVSNSASISVNVTDPTNNKAFIRGKTFSFQWRVKSSGITTGKTDIYIDDQYFTSVEEGYSSYQVTENDISAHLRDFFSDGDHSWYVHVNYTEPEGTSTSGSNDSERVYFKINPPMATASPSSPGSYSSSGSVPGNAPVTFKWSRNKDGDGEFGPTRLFYRYKDEDIWHQIGGDIQKGLTEYTYEPGFTPNTIVYWRVQASLDGRWQVLSDTEYATISVGEEEIKDVKISLIKPNGTVSGSEPIEFVWTAECDGNITGTKLEYSIDGKKTWTNPEKSNGGVILGNAETYVKTYSLPNLPADTIYWHVRAKSNGDYGSWVEGSFNVTYDAFGSVQPDTDICKISKGFLRGQSSSFAANLEINGTTTENIVFEEAQFCWKMESGSDYATEEMAINEKRATINFNSYKFPKGILYWYITAKDSKNNESRTDVFVSYVLESYIDSFPIKPKLQYIDMNQQIPFEWGFISVNGELSSETELCFSHDGVNYDEPYRIPDPQIRAASSSSSSDNLKLSDIYTGIGVYPFEANHFSPGAIYWKVRSRSSDSVYGDWSEPVTFIVTGTSRPLDFTCDEKPFAKLSWNIIGQIAYEIKIDNIYQYGPFHGDDQEFTFPEPLTDGSHILSVRGQNQLGSWGPWSDILVFIQNKPSMPEHLKLTIDANVDAVLHWNPVVLNADDEFLIYRDKKLIARLVSGVSSYMDRLALGDYTYKVIQHLPDGNYNEYTRSAVTMSTEVTKIALLRGGSWIDLLLTSEQYPQNSYTHSRIVAKSKIMGTKHQVIEISEFEENSGEFKFCWPYYLRAQSKLFDSLVGQAVIIKSRGEQVICGVLESCNMTISSQIVECDFRLEQMSVDADLSIAVKPDDTLDMMTNLDTIYFGQMNSAELAAAATNPGYTDPRWYEDIAEAINEKLAESNLLTRIPSGMSTDV